MNLSNGVKGSWEFFRRLYLSMARVEIRLPSFLDRFFAFFRKWFGKFFGLLVAIVFLIAIVIAGNFASNEVYSWIDDGSEYSSDSYEEYYNCSVPAINVHGTMETYVPGGYYENPDNDQDVVTSEEITGFIESAKADSSVKAIILEVDSYGGSPVAGEEIANALKKLNKPSVVVIRGAGASAAYWAASGASYIFASKLSDVGGIGVTMSYLDNVGTNKKDGNNYIQLSSGRYKDSGDPDKSLNAEEKALFMRDVNIIHQNFINAVATNRKIPAKDVASIADGSTVLGERAKELKLIDEIGGLSEAEKYLKEVLGINPDICWQ